MGWQNTYTLFSSCGYKNILHGVSIMAQRVKALARKPDELNSIPRPTWRRKNTSCCPNSTYMPQCTYPHPFPFPNYTPPRLPALQFPPSTQQWWEREIKNKPRGQIKLVFKRFLQHSVGREDPGSSQPSWSAVWPQWAILRSSSSNRGNMLCSNRPCGVCCIPGLESGVPQPLIAVLLSVF